MFVFRMERLSAMTVIFIIIIIIIIIITFSFFAFVTCVSDIEQNRSLLYNWFYNYRSPFEQYGRRYQVNIGSKRSSTVYSKSNIFDKSFKIIWNVPSFQCHKYGLNFSQVSKWGIMQNYEDTFRGDKIALLYDPGLFPALLEANMDSDFIRRNGGVPQEGNITQHLEIFADQIQNKLMPNKNFSGLAIIDFEHWRPIWSENFGSLTPYRKVSRKIEQNKHPLWTVSEVEEQAMKRFEKAAQQFFHNTLLVAKKLRPNALWGYYGFPLCFNYTPKNQKATCSDSVMENNKRIKWLFEESSAIFPSLYYKKYSMNENSRAMFMKGRMAEAMRVSRMSYTPAPVYPYTWLKYYDTKDFVGKNDIINSFVIPRKEGAAGVIIWGASNDVNTEKKCLALDEYVRNILGPVAHFVLNTPKEEIYTILGNSIVEKPNTIDVDEINSIDYVIIH